MFSFRMCGDDEIYWGGDEKCKYDSRFFEMWGWKMKKRRIMAK